MKRIKKKFDKIFFWKFFVKFLGGHVGQSGRQKKTETREGGGGGVAEVAVATVSLGYFYDICGDF